jgi:hypothetical protein
MTFFWYDWAGYIGVLLVLSLLFGGFNWSAFLMQVAWLLIGIYGVARSVQKRRETQGRLP